MPTSELQQKLARGQLGPGVAVWREGLPAWLPASQVPGLMPSEQGLQFIVPTARTRGKALAAGYLGLFSFLFPPMGSRHLV